MPYNTPVDNVKAIASVVYGEEVEFMEVESDVEDIKVEIPDYANSDKVFVEVFTLDSYHVRHASIWWQRSSLLWKA